MPGNINEGHWIPRRKLLLIVVDGVDEWKGSPSSETSKRLEYQTLVKKKKVFKTVQ